MTLKDLYNLIFSHTHNGNDSAKIARLSDYVGLTGDELIAGVKTFSSLPKVPTDAPTVNAEVVSKGYFDTKAVKLDTAQTLTALNTFSLIPRIPTTNPTNDAEVISKKFLTDNYTKDDETDLSAKSWFLDEDDMASDSAVKVASQQSIKAYIDALGVFDAGKVVRLLASDTLQASADTERGISDTIYAKHKEIYVRKIGTIRVKFDAYCLGPNSYGYSNNKIYKNGVAVGTERHEVSQDGTSGYTTYSEDFTITESDISGGNCLIQLYVFVSTATYTGYIKNFRIYYTNNYVDNYYVNLD